MSDSFRDMELKYSDKLRKLLQLQEEVKQVHPLLHEHFPIAIVENKYLNIFEYENGRYILSCVEPDKMNIPVGVRAWTNAMS